MIPRALCLFAVGSLCAMALAVSVLAPVQAQPNNTKVKPHFVGFQKATMDNGVAVIHLKIEGFFGFAQSCRVVFKEPGRGVSHVLQIVSMTSEGTVDFDWTFPTVSQFNVGSDVLSIKMGGPSGVVFDRQEARWVPGTAGGMIRIPARPSND